MFKHTKLCSGLVLAFGGLAIAPGAVMAQDAKLERVEITGSSIKRIDAETALPVTIYRRADIDRTGASTVSDLVEKISANNGQGYQLSAALGDAARPGFAGASMRGLGSNNTLVLLNGRRLANFAFDGGAVSLNDIPLSVVDRIEILRDGASSIYGTDAVAGVINLITRSDYKGAEVEAGIDSPKQKGGKVKSARATVGYGDLGSDGFNVMLNLGRTDQEAVAAKDRPFAKTAWLPAQGFNRLSSNAFPANFTLPSGALVSPYAPAYQKPAGSPATPGALPAGSLAPGNIPGGSQYGCLPPVSFGAKDTATTCKFDYASVIDILPKAERENIFLRGTLKLPGDARLSAEYALSKGTYTFTISPSPISEATTLTGNQVLLPASSPFYPTAWITANSPAMLGQPLNLYYRGVETGGRSDQVKSTQSRFVLDLQGEVAGWDYGVGYLDAQSKATDAYVGGYMSEARTIAAFATGLVNPFAVNTGQGLDLIKNAQILQDVRISKSGVSIFNAKASRELMQLPAGPLGFAAGVESRKETYSDNPLAVLNSGDVIGGGGTQLPVVGERTVNAVFAEFSVPIIKTVESQLSIRHDTYSDVGSTTNPKIALRWQPDKQILLRGSIGTGFRAPTLPDVFSQLTQTNTGGAYDDPLYDKTVGCAAVFSGQYCNAQLTVKQGGSKAGGATLLPEKSKNFSLGMVLEPSRDLTIGIDGFQIYQKDLIGILSADSILQDYIDNFNPLTGTSSSRYASQVKTKFDPHAGPAGSTVVDYVLTTFANFGEQVTRGADISVKYRLPKMEIGTFRVNLEGTYIDSQRARDPGASSWGPNGVDQFLQFGAVLRWKQRTEVQWENGPWDASLAYNWQSSYQDQHVSNAILGGALPSRMVGAYETFDLQGRYTGFKNVTLTAGVTNIFNTPPPYSDQNLYFQVGYDPANTNSRGRAFAFHAKYQF